MVVSNVILLSVLVSPPRLGKKKPARRDTNLVSRRAGLLITGPPGPAGLPFNQSSDFASAKSGFEIPLAALYPLL